MAYLLVDRQALARNLKAVAAACHSRGAEFMLVFKEAGARATLMEFLLQAGGANSMGFCHYPGLRPALPANMSAHLLYMVADSALPEVARCYDVVHQTSPRAIRLLAAEAQKSHRELRLVLPVELGDGRDGMVPEELPHPAAALTGLGRHVRLWGVSGNFACISDTPPGQRDVERLLEARRILEKCSGHTLPHVSVGGSDVLRLGHQLSQEITEIRCGTAVYLGVYPLDGAPVPGLSTTAIRLGAQVMECARKQGRWRAVVDFGANDTAPDHVRPPYEGMILQGISSGYSIYDVTDCPVSLSSGQELLFGLHHRSLARALASPHVPLRMV